MGTMLALTAAVITLALTAAWWVAEDITRDIDPQRWIG